MGSGTATQKLFEVREDATNYGGLCSPVVLEKCSTVGAGTEAAGKCLKVPQKCRM